MKLRYFLLVTTALSLSTPAWAMKEEDDKDKHQVFLRNKNFSDVNLFMNKHSSRKNLCIAYTLLRYGRNDPNITKLNDKECVERLNTLVFSSDNKDKGFYLNLRGICHQHGIGCQPNFEEAIKLYNEAIKYGDKNAFYSLAEIYRQGIGVEKNIDKAIQLYDKASLQKTNRKKEETIDVNIRLKVFSDWRKSNSLYALGWIHEYEARQNIKKAIDYYNGAIQLCNIKAMHELAYIYWEGLNGSKNIKKAKKLYKEAAGLDDINAILKIAQWYEKGEIVQKDVDQAIILYKRAAHLGNVTATLRLAEIYEKGEGVDKDIKTALKFYEEAADLDDRTAILKRARIYENGEGVNKDINQAISYYKKATTINKISELCEKEEEAIFFYNIAEFYKNKENIYDVIKLYEKAAKLNNIKAILALASIYENGWKVQKSIDHAVDYYKKAANLGDNFAKYKLQQYEQEKDTAPKSPVKKFISFVESLFPKNNEKK